MKYTGPRFREDWLERTKLVGEMIPDNTRIVEFGAGERNLQLFHPPGCTYIGYDIEDFDLESTEWPIIPRHDVAVLCGVLEWLERPFAVLARMTAPILIATYDFSPGKRAEWRSHLTLAEFESLLQFSQYRVEATKAWREQTIFRCKRVT